MNNKRVPVKVGDTIVSGSGSWLVIEDIDKDRVFGRSHRVENDSVHIRDLNRWFLEDGTPAAPPKESNPERREKCARVGCGDLTSPSDMTHTRGYCSTFCSMSTRPPRPVKVGDLLYIGPTDCFPYVVTAFGPAAFCAKGGRSQDEQDFTNESFGALFFHADGTPTAPPIFGASLNRWHNEKPSVFGSASIGKASFSVFIPDSLESNPSPIAGTQIVTSEAKQLEPAVSGELRWVGGLVDAGVGEPKWNYHQSYSFKDLLNAKQTLRLNDAIREMVARQLFDTDPEVDALVRKKSDHVCFSNTKTTKLQREGRPKTEIIALASIDEKALTRAFDIAWKIDDGGFRTKWLEHANRAFPS